MAENADVILLNGRIHTLDLTNPQAEAVAIKAGRFLAVGSNHAIHAYDGPQTQKIDLNNRTVIPGLNDSHIHVIRGGLNYHLELRWDGVESLALALEMLREQAQRTPAPQWVRIVGGWSEFQFKERRMPTLDEINAAAPDTPVFILHLYARALLNRAALRALGYDDYGAAFDRGIIERDSQGRATGMLIAKPSAAILYQTLLRTPRLSPEEQRISTRHFMRELNRLGITSVIDAGGGGQNYPEDYETIRDLAAQNQLTLRIAYNLFAQKPGSELDDYRRWVQMTRPGDGNEMFRMNGAGENITWTAADFENFLEPRPELIPSMEDNLRQVIEVLVSNKWPFRVHATYDETIRRYLDVFEAVNREMPLNGLHWFIDHAETISEASIERVRALGGGIAIQHRMAYQGEYFVSRYGAAQAAYTPPIRRMLELGVPVGAGTDATRVASYNPWVCLYWLTTGQTVGGMSLYPNNNVLDRTEALRLYTHGSAWFSAEEDQKGQIRPGQLADLTALSADYFNVPPADIKGIQSVLTMLGGSVVYGTDEFSSLDPEPLPSAPDWAPTRHYQSYGHTKAAPHIHTAACQHHGTRASAHAHLWTPGCACFVF